MEEKTYYVKIPTELLKGNSTKALIFGAVDSLDRYEYGCVASNSFIAKQVGLKNANRVSDYLQELADEGWITIIPDEERPVHRRIYTYWHVETLKREGNWQAYPSEGRGLPIEGEGPTQKRGGAYPKKGNNNNTYNNTYKSTISNMSDKELEELGLQRVEEPENGEVREIFDYFSDKIQPDSVSKLTKKSRSKINTRLKEYSKEDLKKAIDNFSKDKWWMEHNGYRPASWFFDKDDRILQFLNLKPRTQQDGYQNPNGNASKYSQFD